MDLYSRLKNISGTNNEDELIKAISTVRTKLNNLVEERMCKVYSSFLLKELNSSHVPARIINTLDLVLEYEHTFLLVPSNDIGYFLVDLTFSQFEVESEVFLKLLSNGYQYIDDDSFNNYLSIVISRELFDFSVDDVFYSEIYNSLDKKVK